MTRHGGDSAAAPAPPAPPAPMTTARRSSAETTLLSDFLELTKPGITRLVTVTSLVGFAMAAMLYGLEGRSTLSLAIMALGAAVGTALCSAGAAALNELLEQDRDAQMRRTAGRPIPAGRLSARAGWIIGATLSLLGVGLLLALTNWVAAMVASVTIVTYVWVYTPLKPVTPLATIVGAAPGAFPPLIGWTAAAPGDWHGLGDPGGWAIFAIMVVWQIPHFLALAWKYREDYARGGHRVLPVVDPSGASTAATMLLWCVTLIPISLVAVLAMEPAQPRAEPLLGAFYIATAIVLGLGLLFLTVRFVRVRTDKAAMSVFFGSIAYLPLLLAAMVGDALFSTLWK